MIDFGNWLRKLREAQGYDLRTFGRRTGVDPSTISRIENRHTQVTLDTAIRICLSVGITLPQLSESLGFNFMGIDKASSKSGHVIPVLTLEDLEEFLNVLGIFPSYALGVLAELIDLLRPIESSQQYSLPNITVRPYSPEQIMFLLVPHPIFRTTLQYPLKISANQILRTYQLGGILNLMDVGAYLRALRNERKATVAAFAAVTKRSATSITKLELGVVENVKLSDVLDLDDQLNSYGKIIALYWEAIALNVKITDLKVNPELVNILVVVCRWLQSDLESAPRSWLINLRRNLANPRAD